MFLWYTQNLGKVKKENLVKANFVFKGEDLSLDLGFRNFLCVQEMVSVLFRVSQNLVLTRESSIYLISLILNGLT